MIAPMECEAPEFDTSGGLSGGDIQADFFRTLSGADRSALLLDFDGTLAPFRVDPAKVKPWAGIVALLGRIQACGRTDLAIVSGRPARDVLAQLGLRNAPEIWGLHGFEHLHSNGSLEIEALAPQDEETLKTARELVRAAIVESRLGLRVEEKVNAVVVHWRGKSRYSVQLAKRLMVGILEPLAKEAGLRLMRFDGGIELRTGRDKGDAVRLVLAGVNASAPMAYLGDDATDEDAFRALGDRGLSVLVRRERKPSAAQMWLRPPEGLREFLKGWLRAVER